MKIKLLVLLIILSVFVGTSTALTVGYSRTFGGGACTPANVGKTTIGAGFGADAANYLFVYKVTTGTVDASCEIVNIVAYIQDIASISREVEYVLYSDSGGEPNSLIGQVARFYDAVTPMPAWISKAVSPTGTTPTSSTSYWVGIGTENNATDIYADATGGETRLLAYTFGSPPATWDTGSDTSGTHDVSIYFTIE